MAATSPPQAQGKEKKKTKRNKKKQKETKRNKKKQKEILLRT